VEFIGIGNVPHYRGDGIVFTVFFMLTATMGITVLTVAFGSRGVGRTIRFVIMVIVGRLRRFGLVVILLIVLSRQGRNQEKSDQAEEVQKVSGSHFHALLFK
jgi:hypothetical protein